MNRDKTKPNKNLHRVSIVALKFALASNLAQHSSRYLGSIYKSVIVYLTYLPFSIVNLLTRNVTNRHTIYVFVLIKNI